VGVAFLRALAILVCPGFLFCQIATFPLSQVKRGLIGTGKTVFEGDRIDEFKVEILGVIENLGPKQSVILARLSGGPLEKTGVMQGMSGSPVYIDGKLVGAVALTFPFSKEPIAGIRPIQEMLDIEKAPTNVIPPAMPVQTASLLPVLPAPATSQPRMIEIATPLELGGFTRGTLDHFGPQLRGLGLEPVQGNTGGGNPDPVFGDPKLVRPGSMISVQLMSGDMSVSAEGTVTAVDGDRVYAFGHRFLEGGPTALPFARAEVLALLPNVSASFKISAAREWMGAITQDRSVGIAGGLGRRVRTIPVRIEVNSPGTPGAAKSIEYRMRMVDDRVLSPLLLQIAVFSALDATERTMGPSSITVSGEVEFEGNLPPVRLDNLYSGDFNLPLQASLNTAVPLSYTMQSGFDQLRVKNIHLRIGARDRRKQWQIDQVACSDHEVRPGDTVEIVTTLNGENGAELTRKTPYTVPVGAEPGTLSFTVSDATSSNLAEYQQWIGSSPRTPDQVVDFLNGLRPNNKAYVRVWRQDPSYQVNGQDLPDLPSSAALIFARQQTSSGTVPLGRGSKLAEIPLDAGDGVVTGAKTVQVEIRE
jgi:hypothetical protein